MPWDNTPRIEVVAGRHGFFNLLGVGRIPLGGAIILRNMTLGDYTWRTGGGAARLGVAITGTPQIVHAIDYWPTPDRQRNVAVGGNGTIYKDDGTGRDWASLVSGIAQGGGAVPHFSIAGAEAAGELRKLFYVDRRNTPRVLVGDAAAMAAITRPPADWAGTSQPGWMAAHQGYNWGGGNINAPHTVYRSLASNHQDFLTSPYTLITGPESREQYTVSGISYKGGLVVGKFPVGTYFIDTSTDLDPLHWTAQLVALPGWAGPHSGGVVEDAVVWMAPDGSWHSLADVQGIQKASIRASSLSYRKLTSWPAQNVNLGLSALSDFVYYSDRQELMLSYARIGSVRMDSRLHLDVNNKDEVGENWVQWDRDLNSCLFLRQLPGGRTIPVFGDYAGQLWLLDQESRDADGAGYTSEYMMADTDFSMLYPRWAGRKKNAHFLQLEYVSPNFSFDKTIEVWLDGQKTQTIPVTLKAKGALLPAATPIALAPVPLQLTPYYRLYGQFTRMAIRGLSEAVDGDMNITKLILGCELAA